MEYNFNDAEFEARFKEWLIDKGYEEATPDENSGEKPLYIRCIEKVINWENKDIGGYKNSWSLLAEDIDECLQIYGELGVKSDKGKENDWAVLNALKAFKLFLIKSQVVKPVSPQELKALSEQKKTATPTPPAADTTNETKIINTPTIIRMPTPTIRTLRKKSTIRNMPTGEQIVNFSSLLPLKTLAPSCPDSYELGKEFAAWLCLHDEKTKIANEYRLTIENVAYWDKGNACPVRERHKYVAQHIEALLSLYAKRTETTNNALHKFKEFLIEKQYIK